MVKSELKLSKYERLVVGTVLNAGTKIINATVLYKTGHAYRESTFFLLIAQEELAKLIILPFAKMAGDIDDVARLDRHDGPYFNHRIKQKIFTSFGIQNRTGEQLERIKQTSLYTGVDEYGNVDIYAARESNTFLELQHAVHLYFQLAVYNITYAKPEYLSSDAHNLILKFTNSILLPALKDMTPEIYEDLNNFSHKRESEVQVAIAAFESRELSNPVLHEFIFLNPFIFVDMMHHLLDSEQLEKYFQEIKTMDVGELTNHLGTYLAKA